MNEQLLDVELIAGEKARRSFKDFVKLFWPTLHPATPLVWEPYIEAICEHLERITEYKNLLINLPPGFAKTTLISVMFPAWHWLREPSERFLCSSYSLKLSKRDSINTRRLIDSPLYQKCYGDLIKLTTDVNTIEKFENDARGYRVSCSVESGVTGERATVLIVDDPISVDDARSEGERRKVIDWWTQVMPSRLNNPENNCRIVVGQRVHEEDLSGFILKTDPSSWCHLSLPLEYQGDNHPNKFGWIDRRSKPGELLTRRFGTETVQSLRAQLGASGFSAQYNQAPAPASGEFFRADWFRYYEEAGGNYLIEGKLIAPESCWRFATVDLAISTKSTADYTVAAIWDATPEGELILVHLHRGRIEGTRIVPTLKALNHEYRPSYWGIEDVAFQRLILQQARQQGLTVRSLKPESDKIVRSIPLQVKMESGQVFFPKSKPWTMDVELELLKFGPNCTRDDIVDCCSYAALELSKRHRPRKAEEPAPVKSEEQLYFEAMFEGLL